MILLSFDIEEFDVPKEHQVDISMEEQIKVSVEGTTRILDCLERNQVKATFFCTANFALHAPDIIKVHCGKNRKKQNRELFRRFYPKLF